MDLNEFKLKKKLVVTCNKKCIFQLKFSSERKKKVYHY